MHVGEATRVRQASGLMVVMVDNCSQRGTVLARVDRGQDHWVDCNCLAFGILAEGALERTLA